MTVQRLAELLKSFPPDAEVEIESETEDELAGLAIRKNGQMVDFLVISMEEK